MTNFLMTLCGITGVSLIVLMLGSGARNFANMAERLGWLVLAAAGALAIASFFV